MPHSEICGSRDICSLPQLIAACHVFHRLLVPRHPPCALTCLTICSRPSTVSSRRLSSIALLPRLLFFHELVFCIVWDGSLPIPDVCSSDYSMCSFQGTFLIINSCSKQSNSLWLAHHRYSINILWHPVVSLCENNSSTGILQFCSGCFHNYQRGDNEIRTRDPLLARQVLSQLSYTPKNLAATCSPIPSPV